MNAAEDCSLLRNTVLQSMFFVLFQFDFMLWPQVLITHFAWSVCILLLICKFQTFCVLVFIGLHRSPLPFLSSLQNTILLFWNFNYLQFKLNYLQGFSLAFLLILILLWLQNCIAISQRTNITFSFNFCESAESKGTFSETYESLYL